MISKSIVMECGISRAFALFTERISEWWPPERRHSADPRSVIVLAEGQSFREVGANGVEVELGAVLAYFRAARPAMRPRGTWCWRRYDGQA